MADVRLVLNPPILKKDPVVGSFFKSRSLRLRVGDRGDKKTYHKCLTVFGPQPSPEIISSVHAVVQMNLIDKILLVLNI